MLIFQVAATSPNIQDDILSIKLSIVKLSEVVGEIREHQISGTSPSQTGLSDTIMNQLKSDIVTSVKGE